MDEAQAQEDRKAEAIRSMVRNIAGELVGLPFDEKQFDRDLWAYLQADRQESERLRDTPEAQ